MLKEQYDHVGMQRVRRSMVQRAQQLGQTWGIVLGTLGRQGNPHTFNRLCSLLRQHSTPHMLVTPRPWHISPLVPPDAGGQP